jgi:hypothetical protein
VRFLVSTILTAVTAWIFLRWAREQSERQIGKMQDAVFNSPGAESPLPPGVIAAGIGLLIGLWIIARNILRLRSWQTLFSLLTGGLLGVIALLRSPGRSTP